MNETDWHWPDIGLFLAHLLNKRLITEYAQFWACLVLELQLAFSDTYIYRKSQVYLPYLNHYKSLLNINLS